MVVADIGAGTGYLSRRMAPAVMPGGKVGAVDVQPEMIRIPQAGAKRDGLTQIEARLGAIDDVRLPAGSVDLAVMIDVLHELAYPYEVMAGLMAALRPGGRVVFVADWRIVLSKALLAAAGALASPERPVRSGAAQRRPITVSATV